MPRYTDSIYTGAGNMGKAGTKARLVRLKQQAIEKAIRQMALPVEQPTEPPVEPPVEPPPPAA